MSLQQQLNHQFQQFCQPLFRYLAVEGLVYQRFYQQRSCLSLESWVGEQPAQDFVLDSRLYGNKERFYFFNVLGSSGTAQNDGAVEHFILALRVQLTQWLKRLSRSQLNSLLGNQPPVVAKPDDLKNFYQAYPIQRYILSGDYQDVSLTRREVTCLRLCAADYPSKTIAHELKIQKPTVEKHIESVRQKLRCNTRTAAVRILMEQGVI